MNICPKCHKRMQVGEGNVFFKIGETEVKTISVIYSCTACDKHSANLQFRVEPILEVVGSVAKEGLNA